MSRLEAYATAPSIATGQFLVMSDGLDLFSGRPKVKRLTFAGLVASVSGLGNWRINGQALTSGDWIGSNNAQPFRVRTNNLERFVIQSNGEFTQTGSLTGELPHLVRNLTTSHSTAFALDFALLQENFTLTNTSGLARQINLFQRRVGSMNTLRNYVIQLNTGVVSASGLRLDSNTHNLDISQNGAVALFLSNGNTFSFSRGTASNVNLTMFADSNYGGSAELTGVLGLATPTTSTATQRSSFAFGMGGNMWNGSASVMRLARWKFEASTTENEVAWYRLRSFVAGSTAPNALSTISVRMPDSFIGFNKELPEGLAHFGAGTSTRPQAIFDRSSAQLATPIDGHFHYFTGNLEFYDGATRHNLIKPRAIEVTVTSNINTSDAWNNADVALNNDASARQITILGGLACSGFKTNAGQITFIQGVGRTLVLISGTALLDGNVGSEFVIRSIGLTDYLWITNI